MTEFYEQLYSLSRDKKGDHERPHKPILLLAILELIEQGIITENVITYSKELKDKFNQLFEIVRQHNDKPTLENPFFFMSREAFWNTLDSNNNTLYVPGNVGRAPTIKVLKESHVRIDENVFKLFQNAQSRAEIREAIISRYFPKFKKPLLSVLSYSPTLEKVLEVKEQTPVRKAAFAKEVKEIYDYRCAACGLRIRVDSIHFVDAAHIIPFSVTFNDHPSNGMALCKNHHWAMDQGLIAPHPDLHWIISERLDTRIIDHKPLLELNNRSIIGPNDKRYLPDKESLEWRVSNFC